LHENVQFTVLDQALVLGNGLNWIFRKANVVGCNVVIDFIVYRQDVYYTGTIIGQVGK
jgi:hypothetical protein